MAKKRKYYVVWQGHDTGVFDSWAQVQSLVKGYPNAKYKSYGSFQEAEDAFHGGYTETPRSHKKAGAKHRDLSNVDMTSWSVDAACSGNPGIMEYRGVYTADGAELFRMGPYTDGTNNIGEFLAIVHALALLQRKGDSKTKLYTDSRTAMSWVRKNKANTTLKRTSRNAKLFDLIKRAETWLKTNSFSNPIEKWDTKNWGEIPADFGRK